MADWFLAARVIRICLHGASLSQLVLWTSVVTSVESCCSILTDTDQVTAILPGLSLFEGNALVHTDSWRSVNGGGCWGLDDNGGHVRGTVRLLTAGIINVLDQLTAWVQVCDSWAFLSTFVDSSHLIFTYTVVVTTILPSLSLGVGFTLVDTSVGDIDWLW